MPDNFDIVFSFDTTGSMYSCLEEVRKRLAEMVQELKNKIPGIRIAIFAHGDYCDAGKTYVTKYINFTNSEYDLCKFVRNVEATSGGDTPECYELVMREIQEKLSWRLDSQKALVLIGDAPPHEASEKQNYRSIDWREETHRLRNMNIRIYAVECNGDSCQDFYQHIASKTFGFFMPLSNINNVKDLLMKICFREAGIEDTSSFIPVYTPSLIVDDASKSHGYSKMDALSSDEEDDDETFGMRCDICKVIKLPTEFPAELFSEDCEHCTGVCMRCVVEYVNTNNCCPQPGCSVAVDPKCQLMRIIEATLDTMFLDYAKVIAENRKLAAGTSGEFITVSTINGDTAWIPYQENMTIQELKQEVEKELALKISSQKILFNDQVLKGSFRLSEFNIRKNDELSVIVPLYCIPDDLDHVVFDLFWEFPKLNPDFLDASCLAFNQKEFVQVIDWNHSTNTYYLKDAVQHSAKNETKPGGKFGHQTIHVYLKKVPANISHLYFTLSSWRSPNLSAFSNPSLKFYEASEPDANLCSTTFGHILSHQAVVMCSLVRDKKSWLIYESNSSKDACVDGNAKKYNPIRQRIVDMIENE